MKKVISTIAIAIYFGASQLLGAELGATGVGEKTGTAEIVFPGNRPKRADEPSGKNVARDPAYRTWTARDGRKLDGSFVGLNEGVVTIRRKSDGKTVSIPLDQLVSEDGDWISANENSVWSGLCSMGGISAMMFRKEVLVGDPAASPNVVAKFVEPIAIAEIRKKWGPPRTEEKGDAGNTWFWIKDAPATTFLGNTLVCYPKVKLLVVNEAVVQAAFFAGEKDVEGRADGREKPPRAVSGLSVSPKTVVGDDAGTKMVSDLEVAKWKVAAPAEARTWTDRAGRYIEAQLVAFTHEKIRIKRTSDQRTFDVPIEQLSDADRAFVRSQVQTDSPAGRVGAPSEAGIRKKPGVKTATEGGFDAKASDAGFAIVSKTTIDHAVKLGVTSDPIDAFGFLFSVGPQFVKDEKGVLNEKANSQAFTAAVLNITPALLEKVRPFTDERGQKQVRALVFALLAASDSFVQQPGQFNKTAFNAAVENLDAAKVKKAADLMGTRRDLALSYLLTASGRFVDETGIFNASLLNGRLDALKATQFTGGEDEREKTFLELMGPAQAATPASAERPR